MKKRLILAAVLVAALFVPATTFAAPIVSIVPGFQSGNIGDTFTVDIVISNLEGAVIGGFDLDIAFNNAVVGVTDLAFGDGLGTSIPLSDISGGTIDLFELSLLFGTAGNAQLLALQGGNAFTLATLTLQGLANGVSPLNITQALFADRDGNFGLLAVDTSNGSIQIGDMTPVPEPGTMLLFGSAAALAALRNRRQRRLQ